MSARINTSVLGAAALLFSTETAELNALTMPPPPNPIVSTHRFTSAPVQFQAAVADQLVHFRMTPDGDAPVNVRPGISQEQLLEIGRLQRDFQSNVFTRGSVPDLPYRAAAAKKIAEMLADKLPPGSEPQYFVFIDRNPAAQNLLVGYYFPADGSVYEIGWDKVSTGNGKRRGYFETPIGIFENTMENPSYRALGTYNDKGWRGLGVKDARVWDFGWVWTESRRGPREIRLLLHATDPEHGEPRLGKVDSKGCVRIANDLNLFLDKHSILDRDYLAAPPREAYMLRKDRHPVSSPGKLMIVSDSSEFLPKSDAQAGK